MIALLASYHVIFCSTLQKNHNLLSNLYKCIKYTLESLDNVSSLYPYGNVSGRV